MRGLQQCIIINTLLVGAFLLQILQFFKDDECFIIFVPELRIGKDSECDVFASSVFGDALPNGIMPVGIGVVEARLKI